MRLEFDKEDLRNEIEFYKSKVFPTTTQFSVDQKPIFARTSIGRARINAEQLSRNQNRTEKK